MSNQDFIDRLRKVFVETLDNPDFGMESEAKVGDVEGWDSFSHINLMLGIESEFGIEFDSDEIGSLRSVGQIREALLQRLENTV